MCEHLAATVGYMTHFHRYTALLKVPTPNDKTIEAFAK